MDVSWNYFRLHLVFFTVHPVLWSAVLYAANGRYPVSYLDSFFLCFSAQTVTGLTTVNLSSLTAFQQAILYWLMVSGSYTTTSWVMVMARRYYFVQKCAHVIKKDPSHLNNRFERLRSKTMDVWRSTTNAQQPGGEVPGVSEKSPDTGNGVTTAVHSPPASGPVSEQDFAIQVHHEAEPSYTNTLVGVPLERTQSPSSIGSFQPTTVAFAEADGPRRQVLRTATGLTNRSARRPPRVQTRVPTILAPKSPTESTHERGFGGFAGPLTLTGKLAARVAPGVVRALERKLTLPAHGAVLTPASQSTLVGAGDEERKRAESRDWLDDVGALHAKTVSYLKKGALWVGRNSFFDAEHLSDEQLEEIGGVEYRAIKFLSWLVPAYFIGTQLCTFIIYTAYLESVHTYDSVFAALFRPVPKAWFSAFQALSAYTGAGMTLVDQGMVPFVSSYTMIISLGMLIMAGNMLMPVFLRLIVWIIFRMLPEGSSTREPVQFLLDHPRRCYLYLFPSHQTWFLVAVFMFLTAIEWAGFELFDVGLPVVDNIPRGPRVLAGLFQSLGVRASGFSIVSIGSLAPATTLLYIVMMYISAYPIAMSIRSTNVYEERSLGVFQATAEDEVEEPKGEIFSKYLGWHVRRQLAYDLWWLAAAVLLICIVERGNIMNPENDTWFNQFSILFEIVSAYATVGLSMGIPTQNYSFSGALKPLSKLVICAVMLRGRHRDLPVAVDRAVLLPQEFSRVSTAGRNHIIPENEDFTVLSPVDEPHHTAA